MSGYHRLTPMERYQIEALKNSGLSLRAVAQNLGRSASSISRELTRNSSVHGYKAGGAQVCANGRRKNVGPPLRIGSRLGEKIEKLLKLQWSPEQISVTLRSKQKIYGSFETIYRHVYLDQKRGGNLYIQLRRRRRYRRSHASSKRFKNAGKRPGHISIDERPLIVQERIRLGDVERDTMVGKRDGPSLLTIVDRVSRYTWLAKVGNLSGRLTHIATINLLKHSVIRTITNDNGPEFSFHRQTAAGLKAQVYFSHPYSSWERGTNENTNGLIRQYYPKGCDLKLVSNRDLRRVESLLNNRPRKCLGYQTPREVHEKLSRVMR